MAPSSVIDVAHDIRAGGDGMKTRWRTAYKLVLVRMKMKSRKVHGDGMKRKLPCRFLCRRMILESRAFFMVCRRSLESMHVSGFLDNVEELGAVSSPCISNGVEERGVVSLEEKCFLCTWWFLHLFGGRA
ncbi:hypothetical protein I3842_05G238700 [Carya illinoinensis]|uniref:Uncharacterized protein n=1 Tax=Carya illinoinensis TaxID=32201 RepID=A0A922JP95_CARIL|nr:hypothetical protein I3842_05G238700 [Carya illinoinensis]